VSAIDRIRFYDGEFLRAFDFSDEQTYHVEMRRRLNRYLHLCGIVQGLTMVSPSGSYEVSIMPGMAIDAFGREIYVYAPYTLGDSDVTNNRITSKNTYDVWLRYQKSPGTPPSSGYGNCNQANQYTRWVESFSVTLLLSPSTPFSTPGFADVDSDDPSQDQVGVLLGTVYVDPTSTNATFSQPKFDPNPNRCKLLGVIAQSIQTPPSWDATQGNPPFSFLNASGTPNSPLSPPASLEIKPNIFADQNLIVGQDFTLTPVTGGPNITITPSPTVTDPGAGSVKIAGDLFVQGNIYNLITSSWSPPSAPSPPFPPVGNNNLWLEIGAYVQQLLQSGMPEFVVSQPQTVAVPNPTISGSPMMITLPISIPTTRVQSSTNVVASGAICGIQFNAGVTFAPGSVGVFLNTVKASVALSSCNFSVTYTVTGNFAFNVQPPITFFYVTVMALCFPNP
jgi:hypothetical protein